MRRALIELLLFLTPFALYGLYLAALRRAGEAEPAFRRASGRLFFGGVALAALGFIVQAFWERTTHDKDAHYVSPHYERGVLIPGHWAVAPRKGTAPEDEPAAYEPSPDKAGVAPPASRSASDPPTADAPAASGARP